MYQYNAVVTAVHDGDTFTADIDLGFYVHTIQHIRLAGLNAIELKDPGGAEALANLSTIILNRTVILNTVKIDKFGGRYDAVVSEPDPRLGVTLNQWLIDNQWAAAWDGKGTKPVPPWPRTVS